MVSLSITQSYDCTTERKADVLGFTPRTTDTQRDIFFENLKLLGLGRQIGPKFFGAFGVFLIELSAPILGLGFEFGPQRIRDLPSVCP